MKAQLLTARYGLTRDVAAAPQTPQFGGGAQANFGGPT